VRKHQPSSQRSPQILASFHLRIGWCSIVLILLTGFNTPHGTLSTQKPERRSFELWGTLRDGSGKPFTDVTPQVFLQGTASPFTARALVDRGGKFKFKKLPPAVYTLSVAVPRVGEMRQSVDIGPTRADDKGRVRIDLVWSAQARERDPPGVSVTQLAIPNGAREEYERAQRNFERRDIPAAEASLRKTVQLAPQFSRAWNELGVICYQTQRYVDAADHFREALKAEPDSYPPLVNLGGALVSLRQYDEALKINLQAVKVRPDDPLCHSQLGSTLAALGRFEEAEESFKRAIALEPGHFSAPQYRLALLYQQLGNLKDTVYWLKEFLPLHPDSPEASQIRRSLESLRSKP